MRTRDLKKGTLLKHTGGDLWVGEAPRKCLLNTSEKTHDTPYGPSCYITVMSNMVFVSTGEFDETNNFVRVILPDGTTHFVDHKNLMKA